MKIYPKVLTISLIALLLLSAVSKVSGEPARSRLKVQSASPVEGISVRELKSGDAVIAGKADPKVVQRWRDVSIRSLWLEMYPGEPPLNDEQFDLLSTGKLDAFPDAFIYQLAAILNGTPTLMLSPIGILLSTSAFNGRTGPHCTGSLTRDDTVLTADHCITGSHDGDTFKVYFPYEGIREIDAGGIDFFCDPESTACSADIDDLAKIPLASPYTLLPLVTPGSVGDTPVGSHGGIAGYGLNDAFVMDNGILRVGNILLAACHDCQASGSSAASISDGGRTLCFEFDMAAAIPGMENKQGIQPGDSGGPMMVSLAPPFSTFGVAREIDWGCSAPNFQDALVWKINFERVPVVGARDAMIGRQHRVVPGQAAGAVRAGPPVESRRTQQDSDG